MWKASFRDLPPVSGEVAEAHFSVPSAHGPWVWLDFVSDVKSPWCGCVRSGRSCLAARGVTTADGTNVFIVVGGMWYCIDAATRSLRRSSEDLCYGDVIAIQGTRQVAIADLTNVTIADSEGIIWISPRIAWDGLRLLSASASTIVGMAESGHAPQDDLEFRIDLNRLTVDGGYTNHFTGHPVGGWPNRAQRVLRQVVQGEQMRVKYFPDTDTALMEFTDNEVAETKEISENIYVDLDRQGNLVSMTVEHARTNAGLKEFSYQEVVGRT